jgi:transcriptional regulator GlxA family with amidase domain
MRTSILLSSVVLVTLAAIPVGTANAGTAPAATVSSLPSERLVIPAPKNGRARPLVLVVADSDGAQTTDFIVPYGVLKDSGVADVRSVSTRAGPVRMTRGLQIVADETISEFDAREKAGADIVIVPAQAKPNSRALTMWLRAQAAKGAIMISVCDGARVLAQAGLLNGKRAVTHWASLQSLTRSYPATSWLRDKRYVQDGAVITTAGVTASLPASLALVEAIGGREIAEVTARHFGVAAWGAEHRTAEFSITSTDRAAAAQAQRWKQELTEIAIENGVDEVSLALQTEVWNRSMRTKVLTTRQGRAPIRSRRGLVIKPDAETKPGSHVVLATSLPAMPALKTTLAGMGQRYGTALVRLATMGMEYNAASESN